MPSVPRWVRWVLRRMLAPEDVLAALSDLEDLYRHRASSDGVREANRWYRRQLRQYPIRLIGMKLKGRRSPPGEVSRERGGAPIGSPPVRILDSVRGVGRDVRHGVRALARVPTLSISIILTVGLGIGGCTAVFAVIDALFLKPLPYPEPDRLARIFTESPPNWYTLSDVDFLAIRDQQTTFERVGAYRRGTRTFTAPGIAERIPVAFVTDGLFTTLGVTPVAGRVFTLEEGRPGSEATALVTAGFASRFLGAGGLWESSLGETIRLDGTPYRVIGVLPNDFGPLLRTAQVFPAMQIGMPPRRGPFGLVAIGRVGSDTDHATATAELRAINRRIYPLWSDSYRDEAARWSMSGLPETLNRDVGPMLMMLFGAVGFVLLIAASNAANLLLARVSGRRTELAVRSALGASRGQLLRFLLTESAVLAVGGVVVGLWVADRVIALLPVVAATYIPRLSEIGFGGPVLAFAGLLAVAVGLLFGLLPALHGSGRGLAVDLRAGGRSSTQSGRQQRYHSLLVGAQLVVAVPLLAGAGLLTSSFARLQAVNPGFEPDNLLTLRVSISAGTYPDRPTREAFWDEALRRVRSLPGVLSVGLSSHRPPDVNGDNNNFDLEDHPTPPEQSQPAVPWILADPGYLETLRVPLVAGRMFDVADRDSQAPPVAIVDETWSRRFFPDEGAVGKRFRSGGCTTCDWTTVVGVVGDVKYTGIESAGEGAVYQLDPRWRSSPFLVVRTAGDPTEIVPAIRSEIRGLDPTAPITSIAVGDALVVGDVLQSRHLMWILTGFSALALILAGIGLYGILSYSVQRRRADIAVRVALGGTPGAIVQAIVGQGMALVSVGLVLGLGAAVGVTRFLSGLLFEVSPTDPRTLAAVAILLISVSLVACVVPARRAVRVDPAWALREE